MKIQKEELYVSVDIETSGPIPGEYSMLSLGACVVGDSQNSFYIELKPLNKNFLERAMSINNLSLEKLSKHGAEPAGGMAQFESWIIKVVERKGRFLLPRLLSCQTDPLWTSF